jgi:hypothetical protein
MPPGLKAALLASSALILIPGWFLFEQALHHKTVDRLISWDITTQPDRHTPIYTAGTYLPPVVTQQLIFSAADSPVIVPHTVEIAPQATLTLEPGTLVVVGEFGSLTVQGRLVANGTASQPVTFTTNESHPDNQLWGGIIVAPHGSASLVHTHLRFASPAVTCLANSEAVIQHSRLTHSTQAVVSASPRCNVEDTFIQSERIGLVTINTRPDTARTTIHAPNPIVERHSVSYP